MPWSALLYLPVELAVHSLVVLVDQLEGVAAIAIHVAITVRRAAVGEQEGHLVSGLRSQRDEIPEHVRVLESATQNECGVQLECVQSTPLKKK